MAKEFKIGDLVEDIYGAFMEGIIVEIDDNTAFVEFSTGNGGGRLPFEFSELIKIK